MMTIEPCLRLKTFWVELFGMVVDRFGTPWMINGGAVAPM